MKINFIKAYLKLPMFLQGTIVVKDNSTVSDASARASWRSLPPVSSIIKSISTTWVDYPAVPA